MAQASPQHRGMDGHKRFEMRRQGVKANQNSQRQAEHAKKIEPVDAPVITTPKLDTNSANERPALRLNRLSPEERKALRKQIRDAKEIYLPRS
ncbi:MAG: hypothetical protein K2P84_04380 [Undibacterium sp.]|nr:hypothetical protein [Undibacterium sp.]